MKAISLFSFTANELKPWRDSGYDCYAFDIQYQEDGIVDGIHRINRNLINPLDFDMDDVAIVFAFPPCDDLAVSGAAWMKGKGLRALARSIDMFATAAEYCEKVGAPYLIENPKSTISTYWRQPDHKFHPCHYTAFELNDNYRKETWLWTGNGFVMPDPAIATLDMPDERIHKCPPGPNRKNFRSASPMGFFRSVFEVNSCKTAKNAAAR